MDSKNIVLLLSQRQAKLLEAERDSIIIEEEESIENFYSMLQQYKTLKKDVRDKVFTPKYCLPFLQPGRLVCIECSKNDENNSSFSIKDAVTWGVIINFERIKGVSEGEIHFVSFTFTFSSLFLQLMFSFQMMEIRSQKMRATQWMFLRDVKCTRMKLPKK